MYSMPNLPPNPPAPPVQEYGVVEQVHHPLVVVKGLPSIMPGEMLVFADQVYGQVMAFSQEQVEVMVFGSKAVPVGSTVTRTNQVLAFPLSPNILGSMLDPLGRPLLNQQLEDAKESRPLEVPPVPLSDRRRITHRLHTGVSLADIVLPIGKGQRELVVGDRKTGKSAFVTTVATTQALEQTVIIYASIGKKSVEIKRLYDSFAQAGILNNLVMIASSASDSVSSIVLTPYSAMSVAEYFRDLGRNVLVILDDLSQHAKFYRELSLLARHFPGRDSYPGNIFSIHAQLLERAGCFRNPVKPEESVSITCLPLAETTDSDLTEYIVSNLISITDGHLLFDNSLFQQGQRPAVHRSLSVTRVGKQTQSALEREISRQVSTFMSKYEKIKELTHFGNELSESSQEVILQGTLMTNFFAQPTKVSLSIKLQHIMIAVIWLGWFKKTDKASMYQVLDNLSSAYTSSQEIQNRLDQLVNVETFEALLKNVGNERSFISTICKI